MNNIPHTLASKSLALVLVLACVSGRASADTLLGASQKLKLPDIIPITRSTGLIKAYVNNAEAKPGDQIPVKSFKNLDFSKISWDSDPNTLYTLIILDLDRRPSGAANTTTTVSMYNQFTTINVPGNSIASGQSITAYDPISVPCNLSTKHRIVLLAFSQPEGLDIGNVVHIATQSGYSQKRENFKLEEFINRNRLTLEYANVLTAIGESPSNGVCSAATTLHSITSSILLLMVISLVSAAPSPERLGTFVRAKFHQLKSERV